MSQSNSKITYKSSGVDIDSGNELVKRIKSLVKPTQIPGANTNIGGFGGIFDLAKINYKDPFLVSSTDGVGTKLKLAYEINKHDTIGIDLVAMYVNDLVVQGAKPLFFLDYFATGKLNVDMAEDVIKGIAEGCLQAGCALIGGETAEMPGVYNKSEYDLAGFSVGIVEREKLLPTNNIAEGDVVIGIPSSGIHSNGFSLIRHVMKENSISFDDTVEGVDKSIGKALLAPTKVYVKECLCLMEKYQVNAFAHITGGGLTENIPRVLPSNLGVEIDCSSWKLPKIFKWIAEIANIEKEEMLRTLNCGIGMVAILPESELKDLNESYNVIGKVIKKENNSVTYKNIENFYG